MNEKSTSESKREAIEQLIDQTLKDTKVKALKAANAAVEKQIDKFADLGFLPIVSGLTWRVDLFDLTERLGPHGQEPCGPNTENE